MKPLFTQSAGENVMTYGLYDRLLYKLVHRLNYHMEQRHDRQWAKIEAQNQAKRS